MCMEWVKEKLWQLNDVFDEYPRVFWCIAFYMALALIAIFSYFPILNGIANLNILGTHPISQLIVENFSLLRWGVIVSPVLILLLGWCHADELHTKLVKKKYRY